MAHDRCDYQESRRILLEQRSGFNYQSIKFLYVNFNLTVGIFYYLILKMSTNCNII